MANNKSGFKWPAPMMFGSEGEWIAAVCPACGKYPGGEGKRVCQWCDRWIEAYGRWSKPKKWWQIF